MFTLFDILPLIGAGAGLALGIASGAQLLGTPGAIGGALVGCVFGFIGGRLPFVLVLRVLRRDLAAKTVAELRADLRNPGCLTPNVVLLELLSRGEDLRPELPVVLDMLVSADFGRRGVGWAALASAFPELAASIADYRVSDPVEECRRKTERLRIEAEPGAAPDRRGM
ncbi:MAG TPA: hypothetical protein VNK04_00870 [Gemmataceae bacterium]|nr:hypothetical protein [Gemmataceae bacterium]